MKTQRSRTTLAIVVALSLAGSAAMAYAQQPPQPMPPNSPPPPAQNAPPPAQPMSQDSQPAPPSASQLYPGTVSQATFPLPDSNGGNLTVRSGMPGQVQQFGPPPAFKSLDTNGDGNIDHAEARAYPPLDSDFLFASHEGSTISRARYEHWVRTQH